MNAATFTPSQERRNSKAITVLIDTALPVANAYPQVAAADIEAHADEAASKYTWSVRRDAYRAEIIAAMTEAWEAKRATVATANEQMAERMDKAAAKYRARAEDTENGPYPRYTVSVSGTNNQGSRFSANLMQRDYTTSKVSCTTAARRYLNRELKHISWADDAVITLSIHLPRGHWVRCEYDTHYEQWTTVYDSEAVEPAMTEEEPTPSDTNDEEELRQQIEELQQQIKELEEQKKESERWYQAFEYMDEVQNHAAYGSNLAGEIDRAMMSLSYDGWDNTYTQKDIQQALQDALAFSNEAATLYDEYLQA